MAAPATTTTKDLSGTWVMNKTLSDSVDEILSLQGVGWILRKTITSATVTLTAKHITNAEGVEEINIDQTLTGGIKGTTENRVLDWTPREHTDYIFGTVSSKSRRIPLADKASDAFFSTGWTEDVSADGVINTEAVNTAAGWTAEQVWGFSSEKGGERRHTRKVRITKGDKTLEKVLVYDWISQ
ncbi:hypothetical protein BJ508DRAFT_361927 [Ascobolus immersus RN42]|uniref:LCCL domain-containing protein n=1 Tax=Ascobolus immersus RN42 TaxID=1160509 RepID=A0A3N4IAX6_ASCIM|nr:hypothetical protein BJ508DRAFT_361927 [Ascobolus immersus RN42]